MADFDNSIYNFNNLIIFLRHWIEHYPKGSWGLVGKMAEAMSVSSTMMSLVLKGSKVLTSEQALSLAQFMLLSEKETDYFLLLVESERAGSFALKTRIQKKIKEFQEQALQIKNRIQVDKKLTEEAKAIYYSHWYYTAIRNLVAIDGIDSIQQICDRLDLSVKTVELVVDFLLEHGLCKAVKNKLTYGFAQTHIDSNSPFVSRHHQNWRQQSFAKMEKNKPEDLFFTSPMSLSKEAAIEIRKLLPTVIEKIQKTAGPSDSEVVYCLNIDWFEF